jgi:hypothetical protein
MNRSKKSFPFEDTILKSLKPLKFKRIGSLRGIKSIKPKRLKVINIDASGENTQKQEIKKS